MKKTLILAIETSCDETSLALVEAWGGIKNPKFRVLKNVVNSQIAIHRPWGGVVPNLAKREHLINLPVLWDELKAQSSKLKAINLIAVTVGPGLEPALWTGINFAQELHKTLQVTGDKRQVKLIGANHLEGHLYSFLLAQSSKLKAKSYFPAIGLIVSGGHTTLLKLDSLTKRKRLGETRDDAVGEAFDKVARLLKLPYPGGPEIERLAKSSKLKAKSYIPFPRPMLHEKNYDFSFSGLKTAVLYYLRDNPLKANSSKLKATIATSFQAAAIDVLVRKTMRAVDEYGAKSVALSGGVASNSLLRKTLTKECKKRGIPLLVAERKYNTDNAAMIAVAGYLNFLQNKKLRFVANGAMNV
jgi:N6-L-threonylcarbamoyladenine synthase